MANGEWKTGTRLSNNVKVWSKQDSRLNSGVKWQRLRAGKEGMLKAEILLSWYHQCPAWSVPMSESCQSYAFLPLTLYAPAPAGSCLCLSHVNSCRQRKLPDLCCLWIAYKLSLSLGAQSYRGKKRRHEATFLTTKWLIHTCTKIGSAWIIATLGFFWQFSRNAM